MPGGRPPKPTALKLLTGADKVHPERMNADEPTPRIGRPKRPIWLRPDARRHWAHYVPILEEMGVLTTADANALGLLCNALAEYIEAKDARERADTWRRANMMMQQFGLTPSARVKVRVEKPKTDDEFGEFMQGVG